MPEPVPLSRALGVEGHSIIVQRHRRLLQDLMLELLPELVDYHWLVQWPIEGDSNAFSDLAGCRCCNNVWSEKVEPAELIFGAPETPCVARRTRLIEWEVIKAWHGNGSFTRHDGRWSVQSTRENAQSFVRFSASDIPCSSRVHDSYRGYGESEASFEHITDRVSG